MGHDSKSDLHGRLACRLISCGVYCTVGRSRAYTQYRTKQWRPSEPWCRILPTQNRRSGKTGFSARAGHCLQNRSSIITVSVGLLHGVGCYPLPPRDLRRSRSGSATSGVEIGRHCQPGPALRLDGRHAGRRWKTTDSGRRYLPRLPGRGARRRQHVFDRRHGPHGTPTIRWLMGYHPHANRTGRLVVRSPSP
ncbi:hypothetical protein GGR56DRAFT_636758 [Xylariaceae sp. FL0804]|nr:hypothetical protein GGR56DRAFT_636758 [Xylariaceae sp. FL0804]